MTDQRTVSLADSARDTAGRIARSIEHMPVEERAYFLDRHVQPRGVRLRDRVGSPQEAGGEVSTNSRDVLGDIVKYDMTPKEL